MKHSFVQGPAIGYFAMLTLYVALQRACYTKKYHCACNLIKQYLKYHYITSYTISTKKYGKAYLVLSLASKIKFLFGIFYTSPFTS